MNTNPTITRSSTVTFSSVEEMLHADQQPLTHYSYGRINNPTNQYFEEAISALENGYRAVIAPSGLSAITNTLMALTSPGDHILIPDDVYGGVERFTREVLRKLNVDIEYYQAGNITDIIQRVKKNTQLVYVESPSYHRARITDITKLSTATKSSGIKIVVDNTWASPCYATPLENGADVSIHSVSKYIGGHSDLVLGVAICNKSTWSLIKNMSFWQGLHASPDDTYLAWRGLQTLKTRMIQHSQSAITVATWLSQHDHVLHVHYPALPEHPDHELWKQYFCGASGRFAITIKPITYHEIKTRLNEMALFKLGFGWGGNKSLICPRQLPTSEDKISEDITLMLSIGLENSDELIEDLKRLLRPC